MKSRITLAALATLVLLAGCASIEISSPIEGASIARPPVELRIVEKGKVDLRAVYVDGQAFLEPGNTGPALSSNLYYMGPGSHGIEVLARDRNWSNNIGRGVRFSLVRGPLWFQCPAPQQLNPSSGQCCEAGVCDRPATSNFGPRLYNTAACQRVVVPLPNNQRYWYEFDCIGSQGELIRGAAANGGARMVAVSFVATDSGLPRHLRLPVGHQGGANSANFWLTADSGNAPGAVIAQLSNVALRAQPQPMTADPPVENADHQFFTVPPSTALQAGRRYWLVLGPGAANTVIVWNHALDDFSIPAQTKLLINTSFSGPGQLNGSWLPKSQQTEPMPAFQVDLR